VRSHRLPGTPIVDDEHQVFEHPSAGNYRPMQVQPRGPLSAALIELLSDEGTSGSPAVVSSDRADRLSRLASLAGPATDVPDLVVDDDVQLALYLLYELHFSGNVLGATSSSSTPSDHDADWEWHPGLLQVRVVLEKAYERQLRDTYATEPPASVSDVAGLLFAMAADDASRQRPRAAAGRRRRPSSIASFVARDATLQQVRELLVLRSPYQLKEADPHTFAIPRLRGRAKAALVEIQADEYGGGRVERMHQELFARSMRGVGLRHAPNHYLDVVPAVALASVNAISLFALNRRLRGALCGHLAAFEMTSSLPAKRFVSGMQRLGLGRDAWQFFDEHVEADAVHEQVAAHDLCGGLLDDEPDLAADVLLGASACLGLDARTSEHVLAAWTDGRTALRSPLPDLPAPPAQTDVAVHAPLHLLRDETASDPTAQATG